VPHGEFSSTFVALDLMGIFVFAITGALVAVRRHLDVFAALVLAGVTGLGGGFIRDVLLGATPPAALSDWRYLVVPVAAGLATFYFHPTVDRLERPVMFFDACGLALFCVTGAIKAASFGLGPVPAALLGMDVDAMAAGCAAMDKQCSRSSLLENPAYLRAAVQYLMDTRKGKVMSVMMPYADGLRDVADWYRQLWAESLGKRYDLDKNEVYAGQTPIKALGATDQHSQVQLYREGPNNKIFNILEVKRFASTLRIPDVLPQIKGLDYLRNATMNKLMAAELQGTLDALKVSRRPAMRIILPAVNAYTVAQVLYLLEVETAMAGRLYHVNTFDQPGVEEGKIIARRLMGGDR